MRNLAIFVLLLLALGGEDARAGEPQALEAFVQESRAKVKAYAQTLQGALKAALADGGPSAAIPVCNVEAPAIGQELSEPAGWSVGRTSYKLRNADNAPDRWEVGGLEAFLKQAVAGEDLKTMEHAEVVEQDGQTTYRYMKAIPVGQVCLACHGSEIDPAVKAQIDSFYPNDRATGYALGELRGAFTVSRTDP